MALWERGRSWYYDFQYRGKRYTVCLGPVGKTTARHLYLRAKADAIEGKLKTKKERLADPLFAMAVAQYLLWCQVSRRPNTYLGAKSKLQRFCGLWGQQHLSQIEGRDVKAWQADELQRGLKPSSINTYLRRLSQLFNWARDEGYATSNPTAEVEELKVRGRRERFITEEEEGQLMQACQPSLRPVIVTALHTGFREGELAGLTWAHVDFKRGVVRATDTKSGHDREVPMSATLRQLLMDLRPDIINPHAPVFLNRYGKGFKDLGTLFYQLVRRAGVQDCHLHDCRHTFASRLVMAGVDLVTVKELMGHTDIAMTMRYAHLSQKHRQQAVTFLDKPQQFSNQVS